MGAEIFRNITAEKVGYDLSQEASATARVLQNLFSVSDIAEIAARNIRTYEAETLRDDVVSYFPYHRGYFNGERRLFRVPSDKEEDLAINAIDPLERGGAVREGFAKLEKQIGSISDKGMFVWVSLRGVAGEEGIYKNIDYRYHQIYIGEIASDRTDAYALKSDIDEEVLATWVATLSSGKVNFEDYRAETFLHNGLAVATSGELPVIERAVFILKDILEKKGNTRFYKETDIDALPFILRSQRAKQEQEVKTIQNQIERDLLNSRKTAVDVQRIIGGQLMMLYQKYQDSTGQVKLSGCSGGKISINELLGTNNLKEVASSNDIFSTGFRLREAEYLNIESEIDYKFDQPGPCRECNAKVKTGPCKLCKPCDIEKRKQEKSKNSPGRFALAA